MKGYADLLRALMDLDPPVWIFGGIAEDALLHGRFTRAHSDVDVLVAREDLDLRIAQANALGFHEFQVRMMPREGRPLVIGSVVHGMNLEIIIFDRDDRGDLYCDVPVEAGLRRFWLPEGALAHATSSIERVEVRTFSPLALFQLRTAVADTFGGFRPKDRVAQAKLKARFFPDAAEQDLAPRIELVETWEQLERGAVSEGTAARASP